MSKFVPFYVTELHTDKLQLRKRSNGKKKKKRGKRRKESSNIAASAKGNCEARYVYESSRFTVGKIWKCCVRETIHRNGFAVLARSFTLSNYKRAGKNAIPPPKLLGCCTVIAWIVNWTPCLPLSFGRSLQHRAFLLLSFFLFLFLVNYSYSLRRFHEGILWPAFCLFEAISQKSSQTTAIENVQILSPEKFLRVFHLQHKFWLEFPNVFQYWLFNFDFICGKNSTLVANMDICKR